jgi:hypothetical protein
MPFELGLAAGYHTRRANREHTWFVFETRPWRVQKSLSDLNGTDVTSVYASALADEVVKH